MLVEFSVQNFRSIHQRQALSLVASKDKTHLSTHATATQVSAVPHVLRSAGMYGANGSGKTNVLRAFLYLQRLVSGSFSFAPDAGTELVPFAFQDSPADSIAEFEVMLLIGGVRFQYGVRLDANRIHEEWLLVYKSQKGQAWFDRKYHAETARYEYQFSDKLLGAKKIWQESTRPNALFLSTAVQLNSEMLRPVFDWIANHPVFFLPNSIKPSYTVARMEEPVFREKVLSFLHRSDIPISEIWIHPDSGKLLTQHRAGDREALFDFKDESLGTQRLFALTGPILDILENGRLVLMDELENSLHPLLVQKLLELFHDPKLNDKGAQLVFTTHNTQLLDQSMFRRDQIWLVEKDASEATQLHPLSDFQIRKDLSLEKAYLEGRFGAIPILSNTEP